VVFCNKQQIVASKTVLTNFACMQIRLRMQCNGWASDEAREDEHGQSSSLSACDNTWLSTLTASHEQHLYMTLVWLPMKLQQNR
jgi:hypothetical protein